MTKQRGFFITFEGTEGSGKSTQARLLAAWLRRKRLPVLATHEPGGTDLGRAVRRILLHRRALHITPLAEMALFMASRAQLVEDVIMPSLRRGRVVICDRFLDSTLAYQGGGSHIDLALIRRLGAHVTRGARPHLTFLLDIETARGLRRLGRAHDRMEAKARAYHERVRRQYRALARAEPRRIIVLDATRPISTLQRRIRRLIAQKMSLRHFVDNLA